METKEGLVVVAENNDFTFSWELKNTIKSTDYDPFIEANLYEESLAEKEQKKLRAEQEKAAKVEAVEKKRQAKLAAIEKKKNLEY